MSKEKQIEEKRDLSDIIYWSGYGFNRGTCNDIARQIHEQGYRKATDVAEEIFAEIEEDLNNLIRYYKEQRKYVTEVEYSEFKQRHFDIKIQTLEERLYGIAKLKKKYTEGEKGDEGE